MSMYERALTPTLRRSKTEVFLTGCFTAIITTAITVPYTGWMLMLAVGVVHAEWIPQLPTLGFWWACLIAALLRGAFITSSSSSKE